MPLRAQYRPSVLLANPAPGISESKDDDQTPPCPSSDRLVRFEDLQTPVDLSTTAALKTREGLVRLCRNARRRGDKSFF